MEIEMWLNSLKILFDIIKEFVSFPICLIFVICLQIIKNQLYKSKIKFKNEKNWFWITLAMGFPLALLAEGINNFESWNIARFIIEGIGHAGGCTILFKIIKRIKIKKIIEIFNNGNGETNGN